MRLRFVHSTWVLPFFMVVTFTHVPGCASNHADLLADGTVASRAWAARVDHPIAKAYLEGKPLPPALEDLRQLYLRNGSLPTERALSELTTRFSTDVATLFFMETVSAHRPSQSIQREYAEAVRRRARSGETAETLPHPPSLTIAFAPGWFYETYGSETGADFRRPIAQLQQLGVPAELIETDENGTVESNAIIIAESLLRLRGQKRDVLLVSASKSGAEVALALGELLALDETEHVLAWLSIGGVHRGSPLADWALGPSTCWLAQLDLGVQGFDLEGAFSLRTGERRSRFAALRFPEHLLVVSYIAVPLSGDVSNRGSFGYRRMRDLGPNDGLTMLVDELIPGGLAIVEPGVDHYFDHPDRELRTSALVEVLIDRLREEKSELAFRTFDSNVSEPRLTRRFTTEGPPPSARTRHR